MRVFKKSVTTRNILVALLCVCLIISPINFVALLSFAQGSSIVAGESTTISRDGFIDSNGGVIYINDVIFRVGVSRDKDTYVELVDGKENVKSKFIQKIPANLNNTLFMMTDKLYNRIEEKYKKVVIGWANTTNKTLQIEGKQEYIDRIVVRKKTPTNPGADGVYYGVLKSYNFDTLGQLANNGWKSLLGGTAKQDAANNAWSYFFNPSNDSGSIASWDIENRINAYANPRNLDMNNIKAWTESDMLEHKLRMIDLLMTCYALMPDSAPSKIDWETAINDWISGINLNEKPVTIVIDTAVGMNPGEELIPSLGAVIVGTIDYLAYVSGTEIKYSLTGWNYAAVTPSTTAPSGTNRTYRNLAGSINASIAASPTFKRITDAYDASNAFSHGLGAMAKYRLSTSNKVVDWKNTDVVASYLDVLQIKNIQPTGEDVSGFMLVLSAPAGKVRLNLSIDVTPEPIVVVPKDKEIIGHVVTLRIKNQPEQALVSMWQPVIESARASNQQIKATFTITRNPAGGNYTPNYISPQQKAFTADEFLTFIQGNSDVTLIDDSVSTMAIAQDERKNISYTVNMEVTVNDKKATGSGSDSTSFYREKDVAGALYISEPSTWSELKEGKPYDETFEAMAGVPSTEKLYLGTGGSEFIVEIQTEYVENTKTERTYRSYYTGTDCEFKTGDTSPEKYLGDRMVNMHGGGTYTRTWTGLIPNNASAVTSLHSATCTAQPDYSLYDAAKSEAQAFINTINNTELSHLSASDKLNRTHKGWNARITVDNKVNPVNTSASVSCQERDAKYDKDGNEVSPAVPCQNEMATANPSGPGNYTITVTWDVPAHIICGPCCQHTLPGIEDNWKQEVVYDHVKIKNVHIWKIDQSSVNGMREITGTDEFKATVIQGDPNIFYNISQQNKSIDGRIRYSVEPQQHDAVVWYEGVRTTKCNGIVSHRLNEQPVVGNGHQNSWAKGILYNNTTITNEKDYHRDKGGVNTGTDATADSVDVTTTEWAKFNQRRTTQNVATIISDMLILQTSSGDQSVIYFQKDSLSRQTQENFPEVSATFKEMWDDNPYSAAKWGQDEINIGSYNGDYDSPTTKYNGTGNKAKVETKFDSAPGEKDPANTVVRPARPSQLFLYKDKIPQIVTNVNKSYITGKAETFWKSILDYPSASGALHDNTYKSKYGANGHVMESKYSPRHTKINDIIVHDPVSTERAIVVGLPAERDQRSTMPIGSAQDTTDDKNRLSICPRDPGLCEFRVLNCTYFQDRVLATFDFENGAKNNMSGKVYTLPSGFTIENVNRFGTGKSLSAKGTRWSIPLSDLDITYDPGTKLYIEADIYIPTNADVGMMIASFYRYDFYLPKGATTPTWNTGHGWERRLDTNITDKTIKLGMEFDFSNLDSNKVFIDGVLKNGYTRVNESEPITAQYVGDTLNIGSWMVSTAYPANFYLDNLKIIKKAGSTEHNASCYQSVAIHTDGLNAHQHTADCLTANSGGGTSKTYNYTGSVQTEVLQPGTYTIEAWGASGAPGYSSTKTDYGKGGYSKGTITITEPTTVYLYVGEAGIDYREDAVFNGGGKSHINGSHSGGRGGGASDIRLVGGAWNNATGLRSRILVAGGGGGTGCASSLNPKGDGGGLNGTDTYNNNASYLGYIAYGGTQTAGGSGNKGAKASGGFGYGADATTCAAGGGGGYYGGGSCYTAGGGGGSSFISGHTGCNAVDSSGNHTGQPNHYSGLVFTDTEMQSGVNDGHGKIKITRETGIDIILDAIQASALTEQELKDILGETVYDAIFIGASKLVHTWTFSGSDTKGFAPLNNSTISVSSNKLLFTITGSNPQCEVPVNIEAKAINQIKIYYDNNTTNTVGQMYYKKASEAYSEANSITYSMTASKTGQVATLNTMGKSGWTGNIVSLRFDFSNASSGNVQVSKIELYGYGTATGGTGSGQVTNFSYTGAQQTFTSVSGGKYKLEVWGAQGSSGSGGRGGYAYGEVTLNSGETLYVYVGGSAGYNGGGSGHGRANDVGGGATHIAKRSGVLSDLASYKSDVLIVAGGGGGNGPAKGGYGGGTTGGAGSSGYGNPGQGGTQTSGGSGGSKGGGAGGFGYGGSNTRGSKSGGGGGGGGWYGGGAGGNDYSDYDDHDDSGGGGGSGYIGGVTAGGMTNNTNNGHGKATITSLFVPVKITYNVSSIGDIRDLIIANYAQIPDKLPNGDLNPIWGCALQPKNIHICNANCTEQEVLMCSEPHHYGLHYDGSNDICWDACEVDANHAFYKPTVTTPEGETIANGKFINMDYGFRIYFPNIGNFNQGQPYGIGALTSTRGKGFVDNMDTTKWTRAKRVKFDFNVIYEGDGKLYLAGEWIELPVKGATYPYYDFYCVLANYEAKSAKAEYEVEAINCPGNNDNLYYETNKKRDSDFTSLHGGYRESFIDIVGRIGNWVIADSGDYRFSNFFKMPKDSGEWIVEGVVKEVYTGIQNLYFSHNQDIRGVGITEGTGWLNTYGTQAWLDREPVELPLSPEKNNVEPLRNQPMRPGYEVLTDISTIGNYQTKMQIVPYYYAFDLVSATLTPADVYMLTNGKYEPINIFDIVEQGWDESKIYPYVMNLDWVNEASRRNYDIKEKAHTDYLADLYKEVVETPGADGEMEITGYKEMDRPVGKYYNLGTAQLMVPSGKARTFIGSSQTNGVERNIDNRIRDDKWWYAAQRWHFKIGLPSSAVFIEHGKEPTPENIKQFADSNHVILATVDVQAVGDTFVLRYTRTKNNGTIELGGKTYTLPLNIPPVLAVYSANKTSVQDVDVKGAW